MQSRFTGFTFVLLFSVLKLTTTAAGISDEGEFRHYCVRMMHYWQMPPQPVGFWILTRLIRREATCWNHANAGFQTWGLLEGSCNLSAAQLSWAHPCH